MIDSSQAEVQMEAMQKLQVRHVAEMTGNVSLSAVSFQLQRRSLPSPQWLAWLKSQSHQ